MLQQCATQSTGRKVWDFLASSAAIALITKTDKLVGEAGVAEGQNGGRDTTKQGWEKQGGVDQILGRGKISGDGTTDILTLFPGLTL